MALKVGCFAPTWTQNNLVHTLLQTNTETSLGLTFLLIPKMRLLGCNGIDLQRIVA